MIRFTNKEVEILTDELLSLSKIVNSDVIFDFNMSCKNLSNLFQDINLGSNECEKMRRLNDKVNNLQRDTFDFCNELKILVSNSEIISGQDV